MYHYLIYTASFKTKEEVKNYKSLEAYKYFIDGWVLETSWKLYGDTFLLIGKVKHSYALREAPLKPWVAIKKNGTVECGHCTCMAGLAETCSHVAAILYWLETAVRIREETTCTSKPNSWLPPSMPTACNNVPYITMEQLEVTATKRRKTSTSVQDVSMNATCNWKQVPTQCELEEFYRDLSEASDRKPAILSLIPPYNNNFISSADQLPPLLQDLYKPDHLHLDYLQLIKMSSSTNLFNTAVSEVQVNHLEELTRGQAMNHQWFKYRAGRITASQLYQVFLYMYMYQGVCLSCTCIVVGWVWSGCGSISYTIISGKASLIF